MSIFTHKIGYARVSSTEQNLDMQQDALTKAGCVQIYEEKAGGKSSDRPKLISCLKALRVGDTLAVRWLDRLGCSLPDLVRIVTQLEQREISFESITEQIETWSAAGKLIVYFFATFMPASASLRTPMVYASVNRTSSISASPFKKQTLPYSRNNPWEGTY